MPTRPVYSSRARNRRRPQGPGAWTRLGRGIKAALPWVTGLLFVVGLGGGGYVGWQRLVRWPVLQLQRIDVLGTTRTSPQDVINAAALVRGTPILTLDLDGISQRVRRLPWVQNATVRRQLPDHVSIEVAEHTPMLLVSLGETYVADADGALFKTFDAVDNLDLPVMTGLARDSNTRVPEGASESIRSGLALMAGLDNHRLELGEVQELHFDDDLGWSVVLTPPMFTSAVRVHLGFDALARLSLTISTLRQLEERHQTPAVIWVDTAKTPDRVQVQLKLGFMMATERLSPRTVENRGSHGSTEG